MKNENENDELHRWFKLWKHLQNRVLQLGEGSVEEFVLGWADTGYSICRNMFRHARNGLGGQGCKLCASDELILVNNQHWLWGMVAHQFRLSINNWLVLFQRYFIITTWEVIKWKAKFQKRLGSLFKWWVNLKKIAHCNYIEKKRGFNMSDI